MLDPHPFRRLSFILRVHLAALDRFVVQAGGAQFARDERDGRFDSRVHRYDGSTGAHLGSFGTGHVSQPLGIDIADDGTVFVASGDTYSVARFTAGGTFVNTLATGGSGLGFPVGVELGPDGGVYVASFGTDQVKRFDASTGAYLGNFITPLGGQPDGPNYITYSPIPEPSSLALMAVIAAGAAWTTRRRGGRVPTNPVETLPSTGERPCPTNPPCM